MTVLCENILRELIRIARTEGTPMTVKDFVDRCDIFVGPETTAKYLDYLFRIGVLGLAMTTDHNPRYVFIDSVKGAEE